MRIVGRRDRTTMNFKHLHYFWAAAKAGGIVRAGGQLHISPQTLSGQIKLLEERLGCELFRKAGRGLELTDEGRLALGYADQIFALGAELESRIGKAARSGERTLDFRVGIADSVPKAVAYRLLEPALTVVEHVRLICHEGQFADLLGQLAVHRLDLVIADEPMSRQVSVKGHSHLLGSTAMSFFAAPTLKRCLEGEFPALPGRRADVAAKRRLGNAPALRLLARRPQDPAADHRRVRRCRADEGVRRRGTRRVHDARPCSNRRRLPSTACAWSAAPKSSWRSSTR